MQPLVCDCCGGKLQMEQKGIAICESCGMTHTAERIKEKVQEIKGIVRIDQTENVKNLLILAADAYDTQNYDKALDYCNRIIELDSTICGAWLIRGKALGWASNVDNVLFEEAISAFSKAIEYADEDADDVANEACIDIQQLGKALISTRCKRFEESPTRTETAGLLNNLSIAYQSLGLFVISAKKTFSLEAFNQPIVEQLLSSVKAAWENRIEPSYNGEKGYPDDSALLSYMASIDNCTMVLEFAIGLQKGDDDADIAMSEMIMHIQNKKCNACSWDYKWVLSNVTGYREKQYFVSKNLTDAAKAECNAKVAKYHQLVVQIKSKAELARKEAAEKRREEYWQIHSSEKEELEKVEEAMRLKMHAFKEQIQQLDQQLAASPYTLELHRSKERIEILEKQIAGCGFFSRRAKTTYANQLKEVKSQKLEFERKEQQHKDKIHQQIDQLRTHINECQSTIDKIIEELTKER